jgi:hypothetical protein
VAKGIDVVWRSVVCAAAGRRDMQVVGSMPMKRQRATAWPRPALQLVEKTGISIGPPSDNSKNQQSDAGAAEPKKQTNSIPAGGLIYTRVCTKNQHATKSACFRKHQETKKETRGIGQTC